MSARDRLIKHNLRLVTHVAKKYYNTPQDNEDIISIGTIGLIKAVQSFTYDKNTRFSTFASKCIENGLLVLTAKTKIRLLPALNISREEIDEALAIFEKVLKEN